ncbi:uncharacterized protein LOC143646172 isoform X2 [Tamandua tetradactyla]|uniref:uncharacterized protein LOC143646172 isoform X2 n=1 Tax=Tamandua tetradactyla TaxID=48850 RepID=UPI0040546596
MSVVPQHLLSHKEFRRLQPSERRYLQEIEVQDGSFSMDVSTYSKDQSYIKKGKKKRSCQDPEEALRNTTFSSGGTNCRNCRERWCDGPADSSQ